MEYVCYDKVSVLRVLKDMDFGQDNTILLGTARYSIPKVHTEDAIKREKERRRSELLRKFGNTPAKVLKASL